MPKICKRYARNNLENTNSRQQPRAKICQRYARSKSEATNSRQLPKAKICQRYAQDMPKYAKDMPKVCQRYTKDMLNIIFKGYSRINEG